MTTTNDVILDLLDDIDNLNANQAIDLLDFVCNYPSIFSIDDVNDSSSVPAT
jgi:hypothetical protein